MTTGVPLKAQRSSLLQCQLITKQGKVTDSPRIKEGEKINRGIDPTLHASLPPFPLYPDDRLTTCGDMKNESSAGDAKHAGSCTCRPCTTLPPFSWRIQLEKRGQLGTEYLMVECQLYASLFCMRWKIAMVVNHAMKLKKKNNNKKC